MTAAVDSVSEAVHSLIRACHQAQHGFHLAAEIAHDSALQRLFSLYAQQRTRFAEELRRHIPVLEPEDDLGADEGQTWLALATAENDRALLASCLEADEQALETYREALAIEMPARAHFLISAQFSLMVRVHERIGGLFAAAKQVRSKPLCTVHCSI